MVGPVQRAQYEVSNCPRIHLTQATLSLLEDHYLWKHLKPTGGTCFGSPEFVKLLKLPLTPSE